MEPFKVKGLVCASFTPFDDNGNLNLSVLDSYQKYIIDNGIKHMYLNGSTGEGTSLTVAERKQITEKWMELSRLPGREMKIFVQVGGGSFKDVQELTKHAASLGVDAISTLPPLYFCPTCVDELVDYCKAVGELAPNIPLYYYHIPAKTNVAYDMEEFLQKSAKRAPSLRGIKYTSKDLYEGSKCLRVLDGKGAPYDILYGRDEQVLSAFAIGFQGAIGSTFNFMPKLYGCLKFEYDNRDIENAQYYQHRSVDAIKLMMQYGSRIGGIMAAQKAIMEAVGIKVGPPRYPMKPLEDGVKKEFLQKLKDLGVFDERYTCVGN